jgi:hypothetical protein
MERVVARSANRERPVFVQISMHEGIIVQFVEKKGYTNL